MYMQHWACMRSCEKQTRACVREPHHSIVIWISLVIKAHKSDTLIEALIELYFNSNFGYNFELL